MAQDGNRPGIRVVQASRDRSRLLGSRSEEGKNVHLVIASGGNAGLAAALSAQTLGVKCTACVHNTTAQSIIDRLEGYGAIVNQATGGWEVVDANARRIVEEDLNGEYIHPFVGDNVVRGHVSIVDEIYQQLPEATEGRVKRPDIVASAIGGGGLVRGIMLGMTKHAERTNTSPPHCVGIGAFGGDSWGRSLEERDEGLVSVDPYSKAVSLRSICCSEEAVRDARLYAAKGGIGLDGQTYMGRTGQYLTSVRLDDAYAGAAAWQSSKELDRDIELSCGVAMALGYQPAILREIVKAKKLRDERLNVVVVVCGGSRISKEELEAFERAYGEGYGKITVDGKVIQDLPPHSDGPAAPEIMSVVCPE
jgi:L-serine/L-threonine ammonia-lyase